MQIPYKRNSGGLGGLGDSGATGGMLTSIDSLTSETGNTTAVANAISPNAGTTTFSQEATSATSGVPIDQLTSPTSSGLPASTSQYNSLVTADAAQGTIFSSASGSLATALKSLFSSGSAASSSSSGLSTGSSMSPILLIVGAGILLYLLSEKRQ